MTEIRKLTLAEMIRSMNWTQEEVAHMLDCSTMTVRRKMSGDSEWTGTDIRIILDRSGYSFDQIAF